MGSISIDMFGKGLLGKENQTLIIPMRNGYANFITNRPNIARLSYDNTGNAAIDYQNMDFKGIRQFISLKDKVIVETDGNGKFERLGNIGKDNKIKIAKNLSQEKLLKNDAMATTSLMQEDRKSVV